MLTHSNTQQLEWR